MGGPQPAHNTIAPKPGERVAAAAARQPTPSCPNEQRVQAHAGGQDLYIDIHQSPSGFIASAV